ncbi:MAG: GNAT family N-acetyltransferase [Candidatus Omnitrophica bacterium]|nr:GNAT family N-acetyltransferase [Candidatus Omnitrophota bacterium]
MKVREYKSEDSVGVRNLILSILEKEYPFDRSAYQDTDINDISGTYSGKGNAFFVAEKDNKIVGTVGVKKETEKSALLRRLFVDENYRRRGFGTELLKNAIKFCGINKYEEILFRATDRMKQAMYLCKKMGFEELESIEMGGFHVHKFALKL